MVGASSSGGMVANTNEQFLENLMAIILVSLKIFEVLDAILMAFSAFPAAERPHIFVMMLKVGLLLQLHFRPGIFNQLSQTMFFYGIG